MEIFDKITGKDREVKITFNDLRLEIGTLKTKLEGSAILDLNFVFGEKHSPKLTLSSLLGHATKKSEIKVFMKDEEILKFMAEAENISLNVVDKKTVKKLLSDIGGNGKGSLQSSIGQLRSIAEKLREEGVTLKVLYKGGLVSTIGRDAKPWLSKLLTGTDAIEINNIVRLIELAI